MDWRTLTSVHESRELRSLYTTALGHLLEARRLLPTDPYLLAVHMHLLHVKGQRSDAKRVVKAALRSKAQDVDTVYLQLLYLSAWQVTGTSPTPSVSTADVGVKTELKKEIKEEDRIKEVCEEDIKEDDRIKEANGENIKEEEEEEKRDDGTRTGSSPQHHHFLPYYRWLREDVEADLRGIFIPYVLSLLPLPDTVSFLREWRKAQRLLVQRIEAWDEAIGEYQENEASSMEGSLWVLLAQISHRIVQSVHQEAEAQEQDLAFWSRRVSWWPKLLFSSWPGSTEHSSVRELYGGRLACSLILLPSVPIPAWVCSLVLGWEEGDAWCKALGIHLTPTSAIYSQDRA
ncbi:hypothetical protein BJ684DRAFT_16847 [Piptocephalis cylindrospora]|uniref:Uncharacterized protein n=1 Tax=Piptocephalis cylindrospora TaxID=1907219 RepID=A0A4P9Y2A7_9FUNG|nr:hypothetical protein BJ684DRAFT_16847 [Piptocephalis cylindrospora]|eukprot:RKP12692.1 hypothetical protein BJ684DRAFT_16847 [Piptocephalis cylindrospora]